MHVSMGIKKCDKLDVNSRTAYMYIYIYYFSTTIVDKKYSLICRNNKIVILEEYKYQWYSGTISTYVTPEKSVQSLV